MKTKIHPEKPQLQKGGFHIFVFDKEQRLKGKYLNGAEKKLYMKKFGEDIISEFEFEQLVKLIRNK